MRIDEHFEIIRLPEFNKDMKKLCKKYKTLEDDLRIFLEKQIFLYHIEKIDNKGVFPISGLGIESSEIYKAKKFSCRSLYGTGIYSGIRVIYAFNEREEDKDEVILIEIYYKGEKVTEDRERIYKYFEINN